MRHVVYRLAVALLASMSVAAFPAAAHGAGVVAQVGGGGTAMFDDPSFGGGTTQFGMGVTIRPDGSAKGDFECIITGVLSLSVMAKTGALNGDGSVTFSGPGIVHFSGGGTFSTVFTVTATAGGRGVGTFCLAPPSGPGDCDHETVLSGGIMINTP